MNHPLIQGVKPRGTCFVCGLGATGDQVVGADTIRGRRFAYLKLSLNGGDDAVAPGLILTKREDADRTLIQHRDPVSGEAIFTSVEAPCVCSDCVTALARAMEIGPDVEVVAERDRLAEEVERVRGQLAAAEQSVSELEEGARLSGVFARVLEAEQSEPPKPTRRAKAAA